MENSTESSSVDEASSDVEQLIRIVSLAIIALGTASNSFIIVSFCKVKLLRTVTNYFIVNLAVADIFLLVSLAFYLVCEKIPFTRAQALITLRILKSFDVFCSSASLTSLACVSVDRCLAITKPLRYKSITTHSRAVIVVLLVWAYSFVTFITACFRGVNKIYVSCLFASTFALPILTTTASYCRIFRAVWYQVHQSSRQANHGYRRTRFIVKEFRVAINILLTLFPVYVMWGSFWVVTLREAFLDFVPDYPIIVNWLLGNAPHFAATVNPIIYISMTRDFRLLCLRLLACKKCNEESSFIGVNIPRTTSMRSYSIQQGIPLIDVPSSDELTRSLTTSEDSKSSNGHCVSTESNCVTVSPLDEKLGFPSTTTFLTAEEVAV